LNHANIKSLKVSDNGRFLVHDDGTPFFWLGDTAWELFHKLTREEADLYLEQRAGLGFNVIQAVAISELEGLTVPNAYGRLPLLNNGDGMPDPTLPDLGSYDYWAHVDYIVEKAASLGLYIALLPTWGDKINLAWGKGPVIFDPDNAEAYGRWIGSRYKDLPNIIWVLGGDRTMTTRKHFEVVCRMARGLKEGDGGRHLMTYHPTGESSSSAQMHHETWLDFNMIQSSHSDGERHNHRFVVADYQLVPVKPTFDAEPCYEDHPRGFNPKNGYFDAADVRKAAYYAVFSGACGHTYGHHSIWSMCTEHGDTFIMTWKQALNRPGAVQMSYLRKLTESRPFLEMVSDLSLIGYNPEGSNYMTAARGSGYAMLYSPNGVGFKAVMGKIGGARVAASWFDPRSGQYTRIGEFPNEGEVSFLPPTSGRGEDWILVLDSEPERG